jgi:chromosome segregation ATPase
LQTFTARKKALQDLIDQTIRSHNEKEAQLSQEQTAHHEKVQSLQSEIRAVQLAIDDIETRLAPPREELASLESTLVHLIHKRENTQKELMRRESDAIAKSLNFRDAFPSYLLDENTDRKGHQENVTIRFDVREK